MEKTQTLKIRVSLLERRRRRTRIPDQMGLVVRRRPLRRHLRLYLSDLGVVDRGRFGSICPSFEHRNRHVRFDDVLKKQRAQGGEGRERTYYSFVPSSLGSRCVGCAIPFFVLLGFCPL